MRIEAIVEGAITHQRNAVGAYHPQVFTALGRLGQNITPNRNERQAIGHGLEGKHTVTANSVQAALAVEGKANRRLRGHIAGRVG
ncbi:hypothetical protein D3C85_1068850 [compost metagenome]